MPTNIWTVISVVVAIVIVVVILCLALAVIVALLKGTISLRDLLAEPPDPRNPYAAPKASLARFQFLIFTFVIAGVYLVLCLESGTFVQIPENVVLLLGVSGGTYAASKGIKAATDVSSSTTPTAPPPTPVATPAGSNG